MEHDMPAPISDVEKGWAADQLMDIGKDTDQIISELRRYDKMAESTGFDSGMLAGMLANSNKGIDPGIVAMLNDRCKSGDWGGADGGMWLALLFLIILGGGGGFGWNNRNVDGLGVAGVDRTVVNEANYSRLLDAVGTQGTRQEMAIQGLAQTLNCDANAIQGALSHIDKELAVNQGSIINAVQSCCCTLQGKIDNCCCQTNLRLERVENHLQNEIQQTRFQIQTADAATRQFIQSQFCDQNALLLSQFNDIKLREDAREIQSLREKVQEQRDQANTQAILTAIASFRQSAPATTSPTS